MAQLETLRDIRTLEPIPDISLYLFVGAIAIALLVAGALLYMGVRFLRQRRARSIEREVWKRLRNVDLRDSKKAAYEITRYARYLAKSEHAQKIFHQLERTLEKYKYTPHPPKLEKEAIDAYRLFLEVADE